MQLLGGKSIAQCLKFWDFYCTWIRLHSDLLMVGLATPASLDVSQGQTVQKIYSEKTFNRQMDGWRANIIIVSDGHLQ